MDRGEQLHLKEKLRIQQRRLRILELKEAKQGINTPAEVLIEIEDLHKSIAHCQSQLELLAQEHVNADQANPLPIAGRSPNEYKHNEDPELANSLPYEPEKRSDESSDLINEVPDERLGELLSQNKFLKILYIALDDGKNTISQMQRFHDWINVAIISDLGGRIPHSDPRWKQICFNQHIKLLGVPNMPSKIQQLFENTIPLTGRDSISQMRFSINYLSDVTDAIFERLDRIQNSISDQEQKQYKEELIADIRDAIQMSEALNTLIEKYNLHDGMQPKPKIKEKAGRLYREIDELPTIYSSLSGRASEAVAKVGNSVHAFSRAIREYCNWIDDLIRNAENILQHCSLN